MGHIHAAAMAEYAKDAAETDKPWERWEFSLQNQEYETLSSHPTWHEKNKYRQHARIEELEAQLSATQPAAQGMDAQTIRHISALSELVRMPNAEHFADAHNAAVRHLRAIAAQAKQGE